MSPTGEVGINATISKDITEKISVEHKQSTLKNTKLSIPTPLTMDELEQLMVDYGIMKPEEVA